MTTSPDLDETPTAAAVDEAAGPPAAPATQARKREPRSLRSAIAYESPVPLVATLLAVAATAYAYRGLDLGIWGLVGGTALFALFMVALYI